MPRPAAHLLLGVFAAFLSFGVLTACGGSLLDVSNPTVIRDADIANVAGANARRLSVVYAFNSAIRSGGGQGVFSSDALFSDERMYDATGAFNNAYLYLDTRDTAKYQSLGAFSDPVLGPLTKIISSASVALPDVRAYTPDSLRGDYVAQIYALRGFAIVQMAEDLCPGFPINDIRGGLSYYSEPYTTDAALQYAIATLDTALANGRDSVRFLSFAHILKARALIDLGQYDLAKAEVASVPTDFIYATDQNSANDLIATGFLSVPRAVGNREGATGLPFASARDPRVPSVFKRMRYHRTTDTISDSLRDQQKYPNFASAVVVASGVEARLIEAEAALNDGDPITWLATLNDLRTACATSVGCPVPAPAGSGGVAGLPPLADPGPATRLDTLFKERAFWMYLTGHRLGDMRRLVRRYGRADSTVFAKGTHVLGSPYGKATSIPFMFKIASQYNKHITSGCASEP